MAVLKFGAVDLDHGACIANQALGGSFHKPGLTRTGRAQEQEVADRSARTVRAGQVHLVSAYDRVDRFVLPDDTLVQAGSELSRFRAYLRRVERLFQPFHNAPSCCLSYYIGFGMRR